MPTEPTGPEPDFRSTAPIYAPFRNTSFTAHDSMRNDLDPIHGGHRGRVRTTGEYTKAAFDSCVLMQAQQIADFLSVRLIGNPAREITAAASLSTAGPAD